MVDHFHDTFRQIIHCGDGGEIIVAHLVSQGSGHLDQVLRLDDVTLVPFALIWNELLGKT